MDSDFGENSMHKKRKASQYIHSGALENLLGQTRIGKKKGRVTMTLPFRCLYEIN